MSSSKFKFVEDKLNYYKELTAQTLQEEVFKQKEPRKYLYDLVPIYPKRGGKGLRPALCIATCRAYGGSTYSALKSAAAIELLHNAFLIHDDIEDESDFRRGLPTAHAAYGLPIAVNLADAMFALSIYPLIANRDVLGSQVAFEVMQEVLHLYIESSEGQAIELGWVRDNVVDLTDSDYFRMTLKKTAWYTCIHPCRIGALIGSGGSSNLDRFNQFAYFMGVAFQIQDDVLNLIADYKIYGKEIGGDILEGKRTLMLIHLLNTCDHSEKAKITEFLGIPRRKRDSEEVLWIRYLMEKYGSIDYAREVARQLANEALKQFPVAYGNSPESEDKDFIRSVVEFMVERNL
jgi:geranylgeranyl diphosphate synthase, type II